MAKNEENYDNIFNLLNSGDIVNRIPLEVWNYQRYGNDILLPYDFKAINNAFYKYTGRKYQGRENINDVINPLSLWCPTYKSFFEGDNSPYSVVQDVIALIESGNVGDGLSGFNEIKSKIENNIYANETFNALLAYVMESYDIVNSAIGHAHCQEGYIAAASVYYLCDNAYTYSSYNELDLANLPTKSMGSLAIANNEELTKVILPTSLNRIDAYAIYNNDKLTTLTIPSSVNLIGDCAFKYNKNLKKIYFEGNAPEGLTDNSIPVNATIYIHSGAEGFDSLKHKVKTY